MKLIGIVGRAYYNCDKQKIIQVNECIRRVLASYSDVLSILLLPTNIEAYVDIDMGKDRIEKLDQERLDFILDKCDGFIVPGGSSWYLFDEYVINYAKRMNKPLLAICAGFQAICSMHALNRNKFDMTKHFLDNSHYDRYSKYCHLNRIIFNTKLNNILGKNTILVNSLHHDYVDFEMVELIVSAVSLDGVVEAVELKSHPFFIGVQWHPEYLLDEGSMKIFDAFIEKIK